MDLNRSFTTGVLAATVGLALACYDSSDNQSSGFIAPLPSQPTQLAFMTQPRTTRALHAISPAVQVAVLDASGVRVRDAPVRITIGFDHNAAYGTLMGTVAAVTEDGIATFGDLRIDRAYPDLTKGYSLRATAPWLTAATSGAFAVLPGEPTTVRVVVVNPFPSYLRAGIPFTARAWAVDGAGNDVEVFDVAVTISLAANPAGGTLSGTTTAPLNGEAVLFTDLVIDKPGAGYTLQASAPRLASIPSFLFTVH